MNCLMFLILCVGANTGTCSAGEGLCGAQPLEHGARFQLLHNPERRSHQVQATPCSRGLRIQRHQGDAVFLPSTSQLHACPERQQVATQLLGQIHSLQFPQAPPEHVTLYEEDISGMSSTLMTFSMCLLDAVARGLPFAYFGINLYAQTPSCNRKDYQCWFEEWGNVTAPPGAQRINLCQDDLPREPVKGNDRYGFKTHDSPLTLMKADKDVCVEAARPEELEPEQVMWAGGAALQFIMTPNQKLQDMLDAAKVQMGWAQKMIGMHVRHTDACWETGRATDGYTCNHFDDYMQDAILMREKYGISTIFLATDNQYVVDHQLALYPDWRILTLDIDRYLPPDKWGDVHLHELRDQDKVGLQGQGVVMDMLLLSDCDVFIGHADSLVSKTVLHLMSAKKNYLPPFILKLPMDWEMLGCEKCSWWYGNVKEFNKDQLWEAEEICYKVCPKGWKEKARILAAKEAIEVAALEPRIRTHEHFVGLLGHDPAFWEASPNFLQVRVLRHGLPGLIRMALVKLIGTRLPPILELHMVGASDDDEARADWELLAKLLEQAGVKRLVVWMVGPHMLLGHEPCKICDSSPTQGLVIQCAQGLYHNWLGNYRAEPQATRVAFLLNCGLEGEFKDFLPTLRALLDANVLTVVSNYWYEDANVNRTGIDNTMLVRPPNPEWFFPEGNQNEMFSNELALQALGVRFVARYVRNPFAMRYGILELPPGVTLSTTRYQAMKNGYFHAFHGRNESALVGNVQKNLLGSMIHVLRSSGISKEFSDRLMHTLALFEDQCNKQDVACNNQQFSNVVNQFKSERTKVKGNAWLNAAHIQLQAYEERQELQEQLFGQWCDAPPDMDIEKVTAHMKHSLTLD